MSSARRRAVTGPEGDRQARRMSSLVNNSAIADSDVGPVRFFVGGDGNGGNRQRLLQRQGATCGPGSVRRTLAQYLAHWHEPMLQPRPLHWGEWRANCSAKGRGG